MDATKDLLVNVLKYHPFLIKPNNHELGEIFGKVLESEADIVEYAKKLPGDGSSQCSHIDGRGRCDPGNGRRNCKQ